MEISATQIETMAPATGRMRSEDDSLVNVADLQKTALGALGYEYIGDTNTHTAPAGLCYLGIVVVADAGFTTLTPTADMTVVTPITGVALGAGYFQGGKHSAIKLSGGSVVAYFGRA